MTPYCACSPTENICDAKYGRFMATHNALCHGHKFECQHGYCDKWGLEGPRTWGVWGLWRVKTAVQSVWWLKCYHHGNMMSPRPSQRPTGAATGRANSNIFNHVPVPLLHHTWSASKTVNRGCVVIIGGDYKQGNGRELWLIDCPPISFILNVSFSDGIQYMGHVQTALTNVWVGGST